MRSIADYQHSLAVRSESPRARNVLNLLVDAAHAKIADYSHLLAYAPDPLHQLQTDKETSIHSTRSASPVRVAHRERCNAT